VTFSSIPATYRDLILVVNGTASAIINVVIRFNGDTGSNYSYVLAEGNGTSATSQNSSSTNIPEVGRMSTSQSNTIAQVMDYSATDKHKTVLGRGNSLGDITRMAAARWANTSAVTSLEVFASPTPRTFSSGTVLSLYGVIA
jgi:hypothetical protein